MAVLVLHVFEQAVVGCEPRRARPPTRHHQRIEQHARFVLERGVGVEDFAPLRLERPDPRPDQPADRALGEPFSRMIFEGPAERLTLTENTQPAILATSIAAWRVLAERGLAPAFVAGHSLGEYSAHVAAGTLDFPDAIRLVRNRGRYMQEAVPVGTGAPGLRVMISVPSMDTVNEVPSKVIFAS